MSKSRGGRPPGPPLAVERLEDRDTPAFLSAPGATIAIGEVIPGTEPTQLDPNGQVVVSAVRANEIVLGTGAGGGPVVRIYNLAGQLQRAFFAYDPAMRAGVDVATGDVNGDGLDEIITAAGPGGGPNVKVFDRNGNTLASFFAYDSGFRGGVSIAAGDVTGDGKAEIVTGPGNGGGPVVRVFTGTGRVLNTILTFDATFRGGVNVAVGDVDLDSPGEEIVTGAGVGGGPVVQAFTRTGERRAAFFAFDESERGGVGVAAGDTDFGGADEIYAFRGPGFDSRVKGFSVDDPARGPILLTDFIAYDQDPGYFGGVNLAVGDANADGVGDVLTVQATGAFLQQPSVFTGSPDLVPQGANRTLDPGFYAADDNWTYYFPAGFTTARRFPILFLFDPAGNTSNGINGAYDQQVKLAADRLGVNGQNGFIVATSRYYRSAANGGTRDRASFSFSYNSDGTIQAGQGYLNLIGQIKDVLAKFTNVQSRQYPELQTGRVILGGYGEGGSVAHALNLIDLTLADAVFSDQGPVFGTKVLVPGDPTSTTVYGPPFDRYAIEFANSISTRLIRNGSRKVYQFIRSANDPFFNEVTRDRDVIYDGLGYTGSADPVLAANPAGSPAPDYLPYLTQLFAQPSWVNPP